MTVFGEDIAFLKGAPYFHLHYVGTSHHCRQSIETWAGSRHEIYKLTHAEDPEQARQVFKQQKLRVARYAGCLIVIWHMGSEATDFDSLTQRLKQLDFDGQTVFYLLAEQPIPITFQQRTEAVGAGVLGAGDLEDCLATMTSLLEEGLPPSQGMNLRPSFAKNPARWLRDLHHDYFGNFLVGCHECLAAPEHARMQNDLFYLQTTLLNLLVYPFRHYQTQFAMPNQEETPPLKAQVQAMSTRLLVPENLTTLFSDVDCQPTNYGQDRLPDMEAGNEELTLLVTDPQQQAATSLASRPRSGQIWVSDTPVSLSWKAWRQAFSQGVIAAYTIAQLTGEPYHPLSKKKLPYWQCAAYLSLDEILLKIQALLAKTFGILRPSMELEELAPVFMAWMALGNAKFLYLDPSKNNETKETKP